jgi:putative transposase
MSWVRLWVHLVFSTKDKIPFMNSSERRRMIQEHILQNAKEKEIRLDAVNGFQEHLHCLFTLNKEDSISKVAQLIKGESSFWINKNKIVQGHFGWQDDYWAVSVSENDVPRVRDYIHSQEEHHRKKSFEEEVEIFLKQYYPSDEADGNA